MEGQEKNKIFGLLGKNISYSFSKGYFSEKFQNQNINNTVYVNFDIPIIDKVLDVFQTRNLKGLNVTIPYKESVIQYLDDVDSIAKEIGAVNTIQFKNGKRIGYNTDVIGFKNSMQPLLKPHHKKALILGTGGASKAIEFVLNQLNIHSIFVSREPTINQISYKEISKSIIENHTVIINCTPLGTFPNIENSPNLPYQNLTTNHILFDLIYNPSETKFLQLGKQNGAVIKNGLEMFVLQAEASWEIWNS